MSEKKNIFVLDENKRYRDMTQETSIYNWSRWYCYITYLTSPTRKYKSKYDIHLAKFTENFWKQNIPPKEFTFSSQESTSFIFKSVYCNFCVGQSFLIIFTYLVSLREKCPNTEIFLFRIFPYLNIFHTVIIFTDT